MAHVAVVGGGIIGMFTALEATVHGHRVTLFDPWMIASEYSASRGYSRRGDTFGATPLANTVQRESLELYRRFEMQCERQVLYPSRILELGLPSSTSFEKVRRQVLAAAESVETLSTRDVFERFHGAINCPPEWEGLLIEDGYLCDPEQVMHTLNGLLNATGLFRRVQALITSAHYSKGQWHVERSGSQTFAGFDAVIIAAGSELKSLAHSVGVNLPLVITAEQFAHVGVSSNQQLFYGALPMIRTSDPEGGAGYGINPTPPSAGAKHYIRIMDRSGGPEIASITTIPVTSSKRMEKTAKGVREIIPALPKVEPRSIHACHYVVTPDWLPVIGSPQNGLVYVGGCSGGGFKKAPVLGREALRMALGMSPECDLSDWSAARFNT